MKILTLNIDTYDYDRAIDFTVYYNKKEYLVNHQIYVKNAEKGKRYTSLSQRTIEKLGVKEAGSSSDIVWVY
jgi:hypothetical protein